MPLQLAVAYHGRQEDGLAGSHEVVDELVSADFVGQGVIGENHLGLSQARCQTGYDGLRQLLELLRGVLSLQTTNLTT